MNRAAFQSLAREWRERLRTSGFQDIEAPSGIIARRAVPGARPAEVAELEAARSFMHEHRFSSTWERQVWELHAEGVSNREIARKLRNGRKRVEATLAKLTAIMGGQIPAERRRGRPRDPDGFRAEDMHVSCYLLPAHALALDHARAALRVSRGEAIRRGLLLLATKMRGQ